MIKKISLFSIILVLLSSFFAFWDWQEIINNMEKQLEQTKINELNEDFKLETFQTNENFESFIADKLYNKLIEHCSSKYYPEHFYRRWKLKQLEYSPNDTDSVWNMTLSAPKSASTSTNNVYTDSVWNMTLSAPKSASTSTNNVSYGQTNLQKENVDEPEILKLNKDFIAYYNKNQWNIYIIKSPHNNEKFDLNIWEIKDTIKIPSIINSSNVQMFFQNNQLIVIWSRYSETFWWYITDVVFYNIDTIWKVKFDRIYDVKWNYKDARITNWKIYLITDYIFSNVVNKLCTNIYDWIKSKLWNVDDYNKIQEEIKNLLKSLNKEEIIKKLKDELIQKSIDIKVDKNKKLTFNKKVYPFDISLISPSLDNIIFLPTKFDNLNIYNIKFNVVNIIDLNKQEKSNQYVIFWDMSNWEIHMTEKSLYLVNNYYIDYDWKCRPWLYCVLPYYHRWDFTLIHKLSLDWQKLNYINSNVISWQPINQYSMDEDSKWKFKIFTKSYDPKKLTVLFTFDENFKLSWMLDNIAEGEEFKSSRFIEDKAYLVTFKATDPLFVIDLQDISNPKIIWELKIPWYSLYLHPYKKVGLIQYLIWIWQEAEEVHWDWSLPKNIKIDLYEIDYSSKSGDYIKVIQKYTKVIWNEENVWNGWSYTPVFDNPRSFVSYKNENWNMNIILPVYLTEDIKEERCNINYIWENGKKIENGKTCIPYNNDIKKPYFIWIKMLNVDENNGINEIMSKNYFDLYKDANIKLDYYNYIYQNEDHRTSYYKLWDDIITFEINNNFLNIFNKDWEKTIFFDQRFDIKKDAKKDAKKDWTNQECYYKKPAEWAITCKMYCWQRWVLQDDWKSCIQIQVNAACSCPWFDTQNQCEKECIK